jgi:hypothetical protein
MWLFVILAGLVVLAVLVLAVPLNVHIQVERDTTFRWQARMDWFFGLLRTELVRSKHNGPGRRKETEVQSQGQPLQRKSKRKRGFKPILLVLASEGFMKELVKFLRNSWAGLVWRDLNLDMHFGCSDPADTGAVWGLLMAPLIRAGWPSSSLRIQPDFSEERLQFSLKGTIRVLPLSFGVAFLVFLARPATLRALLVLAR